MGRRKGGRECCIDKLEKQTPSLLYIYYVQPTQLTPFFYLLFYPVILLLCSYLFLFFSFIQKKLYYNKALLLDMCI